LQNEVDPFAFWLANQHEFPLISKHAFDWLSITATSADVERVFSRAGLLTEHRKANTGGQMLENKVMLAFNKKIFT